MKSMLRALAGAAVLSVSSLAAMADTPKDTLVMAHKIDELITLDPAEAFELIGGEYLGNTYDRLIKYDLSDVSHIYGEVADSWTVSPDGQTFTFKIRKGIKFASGNPLTAKDVEFSLHRAVILNKNPGFILTQFGFSKDNVAQNIKATDDSTLVFKITEKFAPTFVLYCLTANVASIVDSVEVKKHSEGPEDLGNKWLRINYAGSGPFKMMQWKPNETLTLAANETYWRGAPTVKRVVLRHVPEASTQRLMLEKGDIDMARNLTPDQVKALQANKDVRIQSSLKGAIHYFGLNTKNPNFAKPQVRQAMKYLVDYEGLGNTVMSGIAVPHQSFLPEGMMGAIKDNPYKLDVAKAKALLAEAGLKDGFKISMDVRNSSPFIDIAQSLQNTFKQGGITLELVPADNKTTLTKYRARQHDIYLGQWSPDYQDPHTNAQTFAANYDNTDATKAKTLAWRNSWDIPELTKKTMAAAAELDAAKRQKMYEEIQREHQKDSPFVIMFQEVELAAMRNNVNGFVMGPSYDNNSYHGITK